MEHFECRHHNPIDGDLLLLVTIQGTEQSRKKYAVCHHSYIQYQVVVTSEDVGSSLSGKFALVLVVADSRMVSLTG